MIFGRIWHWILRTVLRRAPSEEALARPDVVNLTTSPALAEILPPPPNGEIPHKERRGNIFHIRRPFPELEPPPPICLIEPRPKPQPKVLTRARRARERDIFLPQAKPPIERSAEPTPKPPRPPKPATPIDRDAPITIPPGDDGDGAWNFDRDGVEDSGTFYFRRSLLNDLPVYFEVLARMKGAHRSAYDLFSQIGGTLIPNSSIMPIGELPTFWRDPETRPAFGAIAVSLDSPDTKKAYYPRICHFHKVNPPPIYVEPFDGDVYEYASYFDARNATADGRKWPRWLRENGFVHLFHLGVDRKCNVRVLKHLQTRYHRIHHKKPKVETSEFAYRLWDLPPFLRDWWGDHKDRPGHGKSCEAWAIGQFCGCAHMAAAQETGVRIEITNKAGLTAAFGIDMKRTAYFFKDRDLVLTPKGKKARIFHIVRPHIRTQKSGKQTAVHMHFAGLRRFRWADYDVYLSVPGLHHDPLIEMTMPLADMEAWEKLHGKNNKDTVEISVVAHMLRHFLHGEKAEGLALIEDERAERKARRASK